MAGAGRKLVVVLVVVLALPITAWAAFKPLRVLAPELLGLYCSEAGVCVDDPSRLAEAIALKQEAVAFVSARVGPLQGVPRAVFCSTAACAKAFGLSRQRAYNVGTMGAVIGPRGWQSHFVRHELIHHLQCEHLGSLNAWLFKPEWFREGMAYSLSDDPRRPLPEPLEGWRRRFERWQSEVGATNLWRAAEEL